MTNNSPEPRPNRRSKASAARQYQKLFAITRLDVRLPLDRCYPWMMENSVSVGEKIRLDTWERGEVFEFFRDFAEPFHSVCLRVDCTETFRFAKRERVSVFLSLVHRSLLAINEIDNFKTRIIDGTPWRFETIHAGSAVGRENGTIGLGHYVFRTSLHDFVRDGTAEIDRVKRRTDIERHPGHDFVRYSVLPWLDFTSLSHAMRSPKSDSAPRLTFGKITDDGVRCTMPVSIHVHHALADGLHIARLVESFELHLRSTGLDTSQSL